MRLTKCTGRVAGSVRAKNKGRRRRSWQGALYGFAVGGPVSCQEGAVVVVAEGEARRFFGSVVAGRDLPLPRFPSARGGVMVVLLAPFSAVLGPRGTVRGELAKC